LNINKKTKHKTKQKTSKKGTKNTEYKLRKQRNTTNNKNKTTN